MKIKYESVTETIEIEVTEEWAEILIDMDRLEYNNNQTETRRHVLYDVSNEGGYWLADEELDPAVICEKKEEEKKRDKAFAGLTEEQARLIERVYEDGIGMTAFARECGISQQAVSKKVKKIRKDLKKVLD